MENDSSAQRIYKSESYVPMVIRHEIPQQLQQAGQRVSLNDWGIHSIKPIEGIDPRNISTCELNQLPLEFPRLLLIFTETSIENLRVSHTTIIERQTHSALLDGEGIERSIRMDILSGQGKVQIRFGLIHSADNTDAALFCFASNQVLGSHHSIIIPPVFTPMISEETAEEIVSTYNIPGEVLESLESVVPQEIATVCFHITSQNGYPFLTHLWFEDSEGQVTMIDGFAPDQYLEHIKETKIK
jgi:hypothetical protein